MSTPAGATTEAPQQGPVHTYDPQHLVGGLLEEEEPIPLLFFTSFGEAWVTASTQRLLVCNAATCVSAVTEQVLPGCHRDGL